MPPYDRPLQQRSLKRSKGTQPQQSGLLAFLIKSPLGKDVAYAWLVLSPGRLRSGRTVCGGGGRVMPPTRIPETLKQCPRVVLPMPSNEMNVAPERLFQQLKDALPRMLPWHRRQHVGEVFDEVEDRGRLVLSGP